MPLLACLAMRLRTSPVVRSWRAAASALAALLALGACAHGQDKRSPEDLQESANNHYDIALGSAQNGSFDDAKKQLELALQAVPEHGNAHYLLGLIQLNEGRTIVEFIEAEMCLTDEAADAQRLRADDLHRAAHESFGRAAAAFGENDPGIGRAYNSMAVISLYFHDHARAREELEHALAAQFYTEKYSALANLGWAFYEQGDLVQAMTELRQSVLMNPDYCVGRYRLAQVYLDYDMNEQALEEAERVITDERCPIQDAYRVAGIARMRLGQHQGANEAFQGCFELAPRSCLAHACQQFGQLATSDAPSRPAAPPVREAADAPDPSE
jgi:type IV pilus assembly protein PilF